MEPKSVGLFLNGQLQEGPPQSCRNSQLALVLLNSVYLAYLRSGPVQLALRVLKALGIRRLQQHVASPLPYTPK